MSEQKQANEIKFLPIMSTEKGKEKSQKDENGIPCVEDYLGRRWYKVHKEPVKQVVVANLLKRIMSVADYVPVDGEVHTRVISLEELERDFTMEELFADAMILFMVFGDHDHDLIRDVTLRDVTEHNFSFQILEEGKIKYSFFDFHCALYQNERMLIDHLPCFSNEFRVCISQFPYLQANRNFLELSEAIYSIFYEKFTFSDGELKKVFEYNPIIKLLKQKLDLLKNRTMGESGRRFIESIFEKIKKEGGEQMADYQFNSPDSILQYFQKRIPEFEDFLDRIVER